MMVRIVVFGIVIDSLLNPHRVYSTSPLWRKTNSTQFQILSSDLHAVVYVDPAVSTWFFSVGTPSGGHITRPDSCKTLALHKSCTYLLIYLLISPILL